MWQWWSVVHSSRDCLYLHSCLGVLHRAWPLCRPQPRASAAHLLMTLLENQIHMRYMFYKARVGWKENWCCWVSILRAVCAFALLVRSVSLALRPAFNNKLRVQKIDRALQTWAFRIMSIKTKFGLSMLCISLQAFRRPPCCTLTLLMTSSFQEKINNRGSSGEENVWLPGEMKDFIKKTKAKASYLSPTRCKGAAGKKVTWGNEVKQKTLTGWRAGPGAMSANQAQDWIKKKNID